LITSTVYLQKKPVYKPAIFGFWLIVATILAAMTAPLGSRIGWWDYEFAAFILKWAAYIGIFASVLCLSGLVVARPGGRRRGIFYSLLGLIIVVPMILLLQSWKQAKLTMPPIQDITTNTENPPTFWYAPNSRLYGGDSVSELQKEAYPDIQPLLLPISLGNSYALSIKVILDNGWQLWEPNFDEMHIEATETTFWFGFSDDIVIHITENNNGGSKIDIRSTSRFGSGGDGGTNANRIRSIFNDIKKLNLNSK